MPLSLQAITANKHTSLTPLTPLTPKKENPILGIIEKSYKRNIHLTSFGEIRTSIIIGLSLPLQPEK
jgi:hypothetical protein